MNSRKAIKIVTMHNEWRRGKISDADYFASTDEVGKAIDTVVALAEMQMIKRKIKRKKTSKS